MLLNFTTVLWIRCAFALDCVHFASVTWGSSQKVHENSKKCLQNLVLHKVQAKVVHDLETLTLALFPGPCTGEE